MIVLSDADLERAANFATYYSMQNAGQTCISIERVYVEEPVYDEFVAKVSEKVRALRVGKPEGARHRRGRRDHLPAAAGHHQGPRRRRRRQGRPRAHRRQAGPGAGTLLRADRARGRRPLDEVHDRGDLRADAADHEGRATPTRPCAWPTTRPTAWARRCSPGTSERGEQIARRLEAGAANVNDAMINYTVLELPMGGAKASGLGSRHGAGGIRKYCSQQAIVVTRLGDEEGTLHVPVQSPHLADAGGACSNCSTDAASATDAAPAPAPGRGSAALLDGLGRPQRDPEQPLELGDGRARSRCGG